MYIQVFKRLVATRRAPQIMVLSMLRSFGKIGPQIDQIWAWLSRGHRWSPGVRNPPKSSVTGLSLLVNCYLEIKYHKIIRVNPPLRRKVLSPVHYHQSGFYGRSKQPESLLSKVSHARGEPDYLLNRPNCLRKLYGVYVCLELSTNIPRVKSRFENIKVLS